MAAARGASDSAYIVPHPRRGRVNLQGTVHGFGLNDEVLAVQFTQNFRHATTDTTVMAYVHVVGIRAYMNAAYRAVAAGLLGVRQRDLPNIWEIRVTAPDGTVGVFDSKFDTDRASGVRPRMLSDYPRLFVENCRVDVYTPLYRWRLHALTRMGFADMHEYMEFVGPAA